MSEQPSPPPDPSPVSPAHAPPAPAPPPPIRAGDPPKPLLTRARLAVAALGTAFVIAAVSAAGTQFYGLLASRIVPPSPAPQASAATVIETTQPPTATPATPGPTTDSVPRTTEVRLTAPFTASGELRPFYSVISEDYAGKAECDFSLVSSDVEALRCFTGPDGSEIHDPCWRDPEDVEVVCLNAPWTTSVYMVYEPKLPEGFNPDVGPDFREWALELAVPGDSRPVRCLAIDAAGGTFIDNKRANYICMRGNQDAGAVFGEADKPAAGPWIVEYAAADTPEVVKVPVRTAWR